MLLLSRRNQQGIVIEPDASVPKDMKVADLFGDQGIRIKIIGVENGVVKLGIDAPSEFKILRNELEKWNSEDEAKQSRKKNTSANLYRRRKAVMS
jgi:carbon storage regulator CsrA